MRWPFLLHQGFSQLLPNFNPICKLAHNISEFVFEIKFSIKVSLPLCLEYLKPF